MFVHYHGTKAGFIKGGYPEIHNNNIVFIDNNGEGECIYTHGNYFANFKELISKLNFVKGVVINETTYNTVEGGGYLEFSGKNSITVGIGSDGIEIGLSDDFKTNITNIENTLKTISSDYLKESDKAELLGNAGEDYNTLGKIEEKIKALRESLKINNITPGEGIDISTPNNEGVVEINISIDDDSIKINDNKQLSVSKIDGGTY